MILLYIIKKKVHDRSSCRCYSSNSSGNVNRSRSSTNGSSSRRSKTHKRLKERFLIGRNRTKRANVRGSPLSQATYNRKTEKQTITSAYLASVRCAKLAKGSSSQLVAVLSPVKHKELHQG